MPDTSYQAAMNGIIASDELKSQLVAAMRRARAALPAGAAAPAEDESPSPAGKPKGRARALYFRVGATLAACAVLTVAGVLLAGRAGMGSAAPGAEAAMDAAAPAGAYDEAAPADEPPAPAAAPQAPDMEGGAALPVLPPPALNTDGMGFEGYMAYSADELVNGNPWSPGAQLSSLPVFTNAAPRDMSGKFGGGLSQSEMEAEARRAAEALGFEILSIKPLPGEAEKKAANEKDAAEAGPARLDGVSAETSGGGIDVRPDGAVTVWLEPPVALPPQYSFTYHNTSYAEAEATLGYLAKQYAALAAMEAPTADVGGGDYTFSGEQGYSFNLYEGAKSLEERILGYHFNRVTFSQTEDGQLFIIRLTRTTLTQKLGDYPIISEAEAQSLLEAGHYLTTVPEAMPGAAYIAKCELVYRSGVMEEVFMPYYRFYVEIPGMEQENGLKTYGAYYVPAVAAEYLEALPLWDGSFNS